MKKLLQWSLLLTLPVAMLLLANSSGSPGGKTGSPGDAGANCTQCHSGTPNVVSGWISTNIPPEGYIAGQTYNISAIGNHPGVVKFGFELTAEDALGSKTGSLLVTDPLQTKFTNNQKAITHTSDGNTPVGNMKVWNMSWTAPNPGVGNVIFYASFNAANGNGSTSGDVIYLSQLEVQEVGAPALVSIDPDSAYQSEDIICTIIGEHTTWAGTSPEVSLVLPGNPPEIIGATLITVIDNWTIEAEFTIHDNATTGLWDLEVDELLLEDTFTVLEGEQGIASIQPDLAYQGDTISAKITGQNTRFTSGVNEIYIKNHDNPSEIIEGAFINVINDLTVQTRFYIPTDASTGLWDVHVDDLMLENGFTILIPTGLPETPADACRIYPNPANGQFKIEHSGDMLVRVFNNSGQLIYTGQSNGNSLINLEGQPEGIYLLHLSNDHTNQFGKLIIRY
ncbi:MAG: T9SS type A sorting domain-containing protein [Bacteroidetes bacterium]|nr:T9SS type A sorting domain-containing protein [Bacteroidota bacterium]